jgi:hypothetical protein
MPEVLDALGTVDRIDAGADHPVVEGCGFWHLGTRWVDRFGGDELEPVPDL